MLAALLHTGDINLFPLDGYIVGLEDGLDRLGDFGTDTVTCVVDLVLVLDVLYSYPSLHPSDVPPLAIEISFPASTFLLRCWDRIPGIRVTVYLPPNLVGLKISDEMVAYARRGRCQYTRRIHAIRSAGGRGLSRTPLGGKRLEGLRVNCQS